MDQSYLKWSADSKKGSVRRTNQDTYFAAEQMVGTVRCAVFCVADGMGGTEQGELASTLAMQVLEEWFYGELQDLLETEIDIAFMRCRLHELLKNMNAKIIKICEQRGISAGTTASLLLLTPYHYFFAHCGDSRIYISDRSGVYQLTEDHTARNLMEKLGGFGGGEFPKESVLSSCIGITDNPEIQTGAGILDRKNYFVLVTDGVYRFASIKDCVISPFYNGRAEELTRIALQNGGNDNATAITIETGWKQRILGARLAARWRW